MAAEQLVPPDGAAAPSPRRCRAHDVADPPRRTRFDSPPTTCSRPTWGGAHRALGIRSDRPTEPGTGDVRLVDPAGHELGARLPELAGLAVAGGGPIRRAGRRAGRGGRPGPGGRRRAARERLKRAGRGGAVATSCSTCSTPRRRWPAQPAAGEACEHVAKGGSGPGDEVVMVPAIGGEGRALHVRRLRRRGSPGCSPGRRTSPYLPGVRSRLWRAIAAGLPAEAGAAEALAPTMRRTPRARRRCFALFPGCRSRRSPDRAPERPGRGPRPSRAGPTTIPGPRGGTCAGSGAGRTAARRPGRPGSPARSPGAR